MKHFALLSVLLLGASSAFAAPATKSSAKTALKTLNYCPTSGEKLGAKTVGVTTYKGYKIAFCCGGCPEAFAHMTEKEKDAHIAQAVAKQARDQANPKA